MNMTIKTTKPAFPTAGSTGMTLRDWFAGQALSGLLADHTRDDYPDQFAKLAYNFADAMLAERAE
jgi:hypothetical protein